MTHGSKLPLGEQSITAFANVAPAAWERISWGLLKCLLLVLPCCKDAPHTGRTSAAGQASTPKATVAAASPSASPPEAMPARAIELSLKNEVTYALPFTVAARGLPAVSADGVYFAVLQDGEEAAYDPALVLLLTKSATHAHMIRFSPAGAIDDMTEEQLRAVAQAEIANAHQHLDSGNFRPILNVSLEQDVRAQFGMLAGSAGAQKLKSVPPPTQRARLADVDVSFDGTTVRAESGGRLLLNQKPRWKEARSRYKQVFCDYRPLMASVAFDSVHRRLLFQVENVYVGGGDICARPERYHVISLPDAR